MRQSHTRRRCGENAERLLLLMLLLLLLLLLF